MSLYSPRRPETLSKFIHCLARSGGSYELAYELALDAPNGTAVAAAITKAAAASATGSTWGEELSGLGQVRKEFLSAILDRSVLGQIGRAVPGQTRIFGPGTGAVSAWLGDGEPVPAGELTLEESRVPLNKLVGMFLATRDMLENKDPAVEAFLTDSLVAECVRSIDSALLDPNNAGIVGTKPMSITFGATTIPATGSFASDSGIAALRRDIRKLLAAYRGSWDRAAIVGNTGLIAALAMSECLTGLNDFVPVIAGGSVPSDGASPESDMLIVVDRDAVRFASPAVAIDSSTSGDLVLSGAGPDLTTPTPKQMTSLFQTHAVAIKATVVAGWATPPDGTICILTGISRS